MPPVSCCTAVFHVVPYRYMIFQPGQTTSARLVNVCGKQVVGLVAEVAQAEGDDIPKQQRTGSHFASAPNHEGNLMMLLCWINVSVRIRSDDVVPGNQF